MSIRPRIRELTGYEFAAHPQPVKLDQNELPFDLPEPLRQDLLRRVEEISFNRYPELDAHTLRERLGRAYGWPGEGIVVAPGSNVLIRSLVIAAGIGQTVLTPSPTFGVYRQQALMLGAELREVPMKEGFGLPVEGLLEEMRRSRGVLFVANPAAPTGNLHPGTELEALVDAAGDDWTVVVDEAYCQFAGSDFRELASEPGVISLRTFSKAFGLAGARLGFLLTAPDTAAQIRKTLLPFCVSALQQAAALTLLEHPDAVDQAVNRVVAERERLQTGLARLPSVTVFPTSANFVLLKVPDSTRLYRLLLDEGVVVRAQSGQALRDCLRISVGTPEENDSVLAALERSLSEVEA